MGPVTAAPPQGRNPEEKIGPVHPGPRDLLHAGLWTGQRHRPDIRFKGSWLPSPKRGPHPTGEASPPQSRYEPIRAFEAGATKPISTTPPSRPGVTRHRPLEGRNSDGEALSRAALWTAARRPGPLTGLHRRKKRLSKRPTARSVVGSKKPALGSQPPTLDSNRLTILAPYKGS